MQVAENLHDEAVEKIVTSNSKAIARPLPATVADLLEQRKNKKSYSLNDMIEKHHLSLYSDEDYQAVLEAVHPEQALEGSLIADDFEAARLIREHARGQGDGYVAKQKLDTIRKSLQIVLRRYGISRKERRDA
jgi:hypothetical protein